jgi:uncharacterized protein YxjI
MTSQASANSSNVHTAKLQRQVEGFQSRVQENVEKIADSFGGILRAAQIHDKLTNTREAYEIEVHTSNILLAVDSLLILINELKRTYILCSEVNVARETHAALLSDVPLSRESVDADRGDDAENAE